MNHHLYKKFLLLLFMLATVLSADAQTEKKIRKKQAESPVNVSADRLSDALERDASDGAVAAGYILLAKELSGKNEYARAKDYLKRALNLYLKLKDHDSSSATYRTLAKLQESQQAFEDAIANYRNAARFATDSIRKSLNENDANRLEAPADLMQQSTYIQKNIDLATGSNSPSENISARRQMAEVRRAGNDHRGALEELEKALEESEASDETKGVSFDIKQEIANTLVTDHKHEEAIGLNRELVDEARRANNPRTEIKQLQNLATSYFKAGEPSGGLLSLQEAYRTAIEKGMTLEAKTVLEQLVEHYRKERNAAKALDAYADFVGRLDTLVKGDSTLVDETFFRLQEDRIARLEKERVLKDELIARQKYSNHILSATVALTALFLAVILWILRGSFRKNRQIRLQSLRREMNPHFIFNSLNSVNQFIAENNELEANKYLTSYSKLMRTVMENSNRDFIPLATELGQLHEYLELEQLRFSDKFTYTVHVDETLDADTVMIPNMLIQPQLENAVWHGLRYREEAGGRLSLTVRREGEEVCVIIEDNGIGLKKSRELKTVHQKARRSRGQSNTRERIDLLNHLYHTKITMRVTDKSDGECGVTVRFCFPRISKKEYG